MTVDDSGTGAGDDAAVVDVHCEFVAVVVGGADFVGGADSGVVGDVAGVGDAPAAVGDADAVTVTPGQPGCYNMDYLGTVVIGC